MPEDVKGIPNVEGLRDFVEATIDKDNPPTQTKEAQVQTPQPGQPDLAQFKTSEDLLKAYKEIQGAFTKTSQEKKALAEQVSQMQAQFNEQMELMRLQRVRPPVAQPQPQDFDSTFIQNPEQAVVGKAQQVVGQALLQSKIQDVLEEEEIKAPAEFQERYYYAKMVSQQYPQLVTSSAGVRKLFQIADKVREDEGKKQAYRALTRLFGEDMDIEKLKSLVRKDQTQTNSNTGVAFMPDTTTSTRTGSPTEQGKIPQDAISEAVNRGDVDGVLKNMFQTFR